MNQNHNQNHPSSNIKHGETNGGTDAKPSQGDGGGSATQGNAGAATGGQSKGAQGSGITHGGGEGNAVAGGDEAVLALTRTVKDGAGEVAEGVKGLATGVAGQLKKSAESQITGGKDRAAESLETVAEALRHTGEHLRSKDENAFITDYVDVAADKVEAASEYLQDRNFGQIVRDLESFARREPALFLGGAFVAGLIGGRFLKSSRPTVAGPASGGGSTPKGSGGQGDWSRPSERNTQPGGGRASNRRGSV